MRSEDRWKRPPAIRGRGWTTEGRTLRCYQRCSIDATEVIMQILASSVTALALFRWPTGETRKRGKILREPGAGFGLLIIEGQQFPFSLTDVWQSPQLPKIGMIAEAEFDRDGKLVVIRALDARSRPA